VQERKFDSRQGCNTTQESQFGTYLFVVTVRYDFGTMQKNGHT